MFSLGAVGVRWDKRNELQGNLHSRFRHHSKIFRTKHRFITEMFRMFDLNGKSFFLTLLVHIKVHISRKCFKFPSPFGVVFADFLSNASSPCHWLLIVQLWDSNSFYFYKFYAKCWSDKLVVYPIVTVNDYLWMI